MRTILTEYCISAITTLCGLDGRLHGALAADIVGPEKMGRGNAAEHQGGDGRGAEGGQWAVHGCGFVLMCVGLLSECGTRVMVEVLNSVLAGKFG